MTKRNFFFFGLTLCFIFLFRQAFGQDINHYLKLLHYEEALQGTYFSVDSFVDVRNGFAEFNNVYTDGEKELIFQAACFNFKKSNIVAATYYGGDEQCTFYRTIFYKYDKRKDSLVRIFDSEVLPDLPYNLFLDGKKVEDIILKYLPQIQVEYMGPDADVQDVLGEIYSYHFSVPRKGSQLRVTLRICDYIARNQVAIDNDDEAVIENVKTITLKFNKTTGRFEL